MRRKPTGGKRTLPKRVKKPANVMGLPPAVIGGVSGGHVCERCGKTVPADQMTSGGHTCLRCGHPAHLRELEKQKKQRARVRNQFFKAVRNRKAKLARIDELCDELVNLHGGVREVAIGYYDDYHSQRGAQPGSLRSVRNFEAVFRLMIELNKSRQATLATVEAMTDEQLDEVIQALPDEVLAGFT